MSGGEIIHACGEFSKKLISEGRLFDTQEQGVSTSGSWNVGLFTVFQ